VHDLGGVSSGEVMLREGFEELDRLVNSWVINLK
jgi:hypothetical protein